MKKYLTAFLMFIASIFLGFQINSNVVDAATPKQNFVNYSVTPELTANQIQKNVGYYDLKVTPNQKQTIKFKINLNNS